MKSESPRDYKKYIINDPGDKENDSQEDNMKFESEDFMGNKSKRSEIQKDEKPGSPRTVEEMQANLRQEIMMRKVKNEANQQLAKFKKCLSKQDHNNQIITSTEKIALIPSNLREDLDEAILYAYLAVRYYDEHIFKVILTRTNKFALNRSYSQLLGKDRSFNNLTNDTSYSRHRLNQVAFEVALDKDYTDIAFHFIETGQVHITWDMIHKMIANSQEYLVKQCIKYGSKFDPGSASLKKIIFAGRTAAPLEDRAIKLVDFIQVMLELKWKTKEIKEILKNYSKKGKIDSQDMREMFLLFAVKRKIKLMSFLINGEEFLMEFQEANFIDVIENDAFEVAVLLYREYFLILNKETERINTLLVNSFSKSNGMLEAKCFLLKRFLAKMNFEQANKLLEAIENKVFDSSKGNILILTLNVVKASCLLIEILEKVHNRFSFLGRRVQEIRSKITKIASDFMNDIQSEEEMRFLLLEKDLDERDALNNIYDYEILDLLEHPFAQNIVQQIWSSQYNNSHSIFSVSTVHTLLFNYNHCRYDMEEQLRFYKKRDLSKYGCHTFQFQVWRYSGESRHLVQTVTTWLFIILLHITIAKHMTFVNYMMDHQDEINNYQRKYMSNVHAEIRPSQGEFDITADIYRMWIERIYDFKQSAVNITTLAFIAWLFVHQKIFDAIFAGKNKRVPHMVNWGNFIDFAIYFAGLCYCIIVHRVYLWGTWLTRPNLEETALIYWNNYTESGINENKLLFAYGIIIWMKAFYQLKLISLTGSLFAIMVKLINELLIFAVFYFSVLFMYAVVGVVLFYDLPNFSQISTAMFILFRATIQDYDVDQMREARISPFLGYVYFLSFLILNLTLIINLIVGQLSYAYKYYSKRRGILMLLQTLGVREVQEADEKYSAIISAPFPMTVLNFIFGGIIIAMKSIPANILLLRIYYLPVAVCSFIAFSLYQIAMLPVCYLKMTGHKFALMVKSPQGQGARSTCDRAFQAILFLIFGPLLLVFACLIDMFWFLRHTYMMDLDKSHLSVQQSTAIHRRTYKKMYKYFEQKNEQLVPQKKVAEDLRTYLDVMEGIRCLIYGKPNMIPEGKAGIYIAYAKQFISKSTGKMPQFIEGSENSQVEQVVNEFEVVKQVLLNNSFPVDMREIQQNSVKKKGWGMRQLFDKKIFFAILQDLERMRKILNLKKCFFIFHLPYEGKPAQMNSWHKKVEARVNMTLKFINTARLLRIIGYDPVLHIKAENINLAKDIGNTQHREGLQKQKQEFNSSNLMLNQIKLEVPKNKQSDHYQKARINNVQQNMQFMINKYVNAGKQMKELADIMKQLNNNNTKFNKQNDLSNSKQASLVKKTDKEDQFNYDSQRQVSVNYHSNSKFGISPDLNIQKKNNLIQQEMQVHYSERSNSEAVITSDDEEQHVQKEEINTFSALKK